MWLPWPPALALVVVLVAFVVASRGSADRHLTVARAFAGEIALILALYALWRYAGGISVMKVDHALDRGRAVWDLEQRLHLPSELALQRAVLGHPVLVQAANRYYAVMHVPTLIALLIWAFVWHRDRYPLVRNTLALVTGQSVTDISQNVVANLAWDEVRLPHPVFEGDTIYAASEVLETRASKSRPNVGIVRIKSIGYNQDGTTVIEFKRTIMVYRRGQAPQPPRPPIPVGT
jgi:hypothetical protein